MAELPQRQHPRFEVEIWVDFTTLDLEMSARVMNLSRGGVFLKADRPLPLDSKVALVLKLPDGRPVHATGRVVWNHDLGKDPAGGASGSGIEFLDIPVADQELLEHYLDFLARRDGEHTSH
jgi:uncharacterized protein (TIGR02266 family)